MITTESFINGEYVTHSNMEKMLQELKKENDVKTICKEQSLNFDLLRDLFTLKMKGFNNAEVAQKIGVHRVTIQRYTNTLRKLKESQFKLLHNAVFGIEDERDD